MPITRKHKISAAKNAIVLSFLLFATFASRPARGQIQPANPDSALQIILAQIQGAPLTLEAAMQQAMREATDVREAEAVQLAAEAVVRREKNVFDPRLFFNLDHTNDRLPTASFFSGAPVLNTEQTTSIAGLRMDLPTGTHLEVAMNTIRLQTNSTFAFLNPQYTTLGSFSFRQPLMSGFTISGRKDVVKAERDQEAAAARYDQTALATRAEVEHSYWDLYAATRDFAVQQLIRDNAAALLQEADVRARTGLVGPSQVANARVFLAQQELALLDREEQLDRFSDQLASLVGARPGAGRMRFIALDEPPGDFLLEAADVLVKRALENNFNLHAARKEIEGLRVLERAVKWEALPQVDLVGSFGGNGLAGSAQQVIFGNDTLGTNRGGDFSEALNQAFVRDFSTWSVGVEVTIPVNLRGGSGERARLHAEAIRAESRLVAEARTLEEQVRASHRELSHGKRRLEVAQQGVAAAQEQVRIGLIEFRNGRSTAFELVRLGADLAVAQQRYSQELVRTAKAAATLRQLTSGAYSGSSSN